MPAPKPLTLCEPPKLDWSRPGTPAADDFGDIYFSVDGGLEETEMVYLHGSGLPERWQGRTHFTIGELGFGTGLNFLATWRMWDAHKTAGQRLSFVSVEKFPFDKEQLAQALSAWPELKDYAQRLVEIWPGRVKGVHRLELSDDITLTLIHDDVSALADMTTRVDAWFLDGFSPAKNPAMWSESVMGQVARLSAKGATIGTFTVAGAVRRLLSDVGFSVTRLEGFGRKRHRLEAVFEGAEVNENNDCLPIIIGGGIAGASLARSFLRRGIVSTIIDPNDGTAASGNAAAIVKPRLDQQDHPQTRFFLSAYLYAAKLYRNIGVTLSGGVKHIAKSQAERDRFAKLIANAPLPDADMRFDEEGLCFPNALVIDPLKTCLTLSEGAKRIEARAAKTIRDETGVSVLDDAGNLLATGTHIIWAIGAGVRDSEQFVGLGLRYSRGQISWAERSVDNAVTYGGYAIPMGEHMLLGATHHRLEEGNPYSVRSEDDDNNLEKFRDVFGQEASLADKPSRASVRVNKANTLPLIHRAGREYVLTGLGSRGFVHAPLLAEQIVSEICGEVEPLTAPQKVRFQARENSPT